MKLHLTLNSLGIIDGLFDLLKNYHYAHLIELGQSYDIVSNPRYLDQNSIQDFNKKAKNLGYQTTVHIGRYLAKQLGHTYPSYDLKPLLECASRVQFNRYTVDKNICLANTQLANPQTQLILPACKINQTIEFFPLEEDVDWLYDTSHGRGSPIDHFPDCLLGHRINSLGYAGGINESTIESVASRLITLHKTTNKTIYMDLESGIRTDDKVDLIKIQNILVKFAKIQTQIE